MLIYGSFQRSPHHSPPWSQLCDLLDMSLYPRSPASSTCERSLGRISGTNFDSSSTTESCGSCCWHGRRLLTHIYEASNRLAWSGAKAPRLTPMAFQVTSQGRAWSGARGSRLILPTSRLFRVWSGSSVGLRRRRTRCHSGPWAVSRRSARRRLSLPNQGQAASPWPASTTFGHHVIKCPYAARIGVSSRPLALHPARALLLVGASRLVGWSLVIIGDGRSCCLSWDGWLLGGRPQQRAKWLVRRLPTRKRTRNSQDERYAARELPSATVAPSFLLARNHGR